MFLKQIVFSHQIRLSGRPTEMNAVLININVTEKLLKLR